MSRVQVDKNDRRKSNFNKSKTVNLGKDQPKSKYKATDAVTQESDATESDTKDSDEDYGFSESSEES